MFKVYVTFNDDSYQGSMERREFIFNVRANTWFEAITKVMPRVHIPAGTKNVRMVADTLPTAEVYILE